MTEYKLGDYVRIHDHDGAEITVQITDSGVPNRLSDFMFKAGARMFKNSEILGLGDVPVTQAIGVRTFARGDAVFHEKFRHGTVDYAKPNGFYEVIFSDYGIETVLGSHLVDSKFPEITPDLEDEVHADLVAENDVINSPAHYTAYPVEVIELTEHMNFCRGNAVKYISRAGLKDPAKEVEDLRKAVWYLEREISRVEQTK